MTLEWIDLARQVGRYLADQQGDDTVTVLLGAGGSRSSGAPSTPEVVGALAEDSSGEFSNSEVSDGMDSLSDALVENTVEHLFRDIRPHVGYLSLASLAKSTRVLVVNLNWDPALEKACEQLGVKYASIVIDEGSPTTLDEGWTEVEAALKDKEVRLVNLHLHGQLGKSKIRLAPKRTAAFQSKTIELLWKRFFAHPTVVVGATLSGERDVTGLLAAAAQGPDPTPFWFFSRQPERTDGPRDKVVAELISRNESSFSGDPFIDFDRIMVEILSRRLDRPLGELFDGGSLPRRDSSEAVFPAPDLLRNHLEAGASGKLLALVGERHVGKSTTARLLAHWTALRADKMPAIVSKAGPVRCAHLAKSLRDGSSGLGPGDIVILDDPFAVGDEEPNDDLLDDLREVVDRPDRPEIILTASLGAWGRAASEHEDLEELAELVVDKATDWYVGSDLALLADDPSSKGGPAMVTRRVLEGVASTPGRVRSANAGQYPSGDEDVIEDKLELLRTVGRDTKRFLALVRFSELARTVVPQVQLAEHLSSTVPELPPPLQALLMDLDEDCEEADRRHRVFAHYTDRVAFDRLYLEERRDLRSRVVELAYGRDVVDEVCDIWLTIDRLRAGNLDRVTEMAKGTDRERAKLAEWGPLLLEEAANARPSRLQLEGVLKQLLKIEPRLDFWALRELVYEVVRLWPELHHSELAKGFIKKVLADTERMGCYCVLEAMLYFQGAIHRKVWDKDFVLRRLWGRIANATWDLAEDVDAHKTELALIFDAVAWSRPPLDEHELGNWIDPILDALEREEGMKGALALTCLYHPAGVELFELVERESPLSYVSNLSTEQIGRAAELVRWHYVHQSRGRALITRRRLEPACPELLRREHRKRVLHRPQVRAIEKFVERMGSFPEHRGSAVHLGFNLRCTLGEFDERVLGHLVGAMTEPDDDLVTAAITYRIPAGALEQMQDHFRRRPNRERLLDVMLRGCDVASLSDSARVKVDAPRFMAGRIPQLVHNELDTDWNKPLNKIRTLHEPAFTMEVHDILTVIVEEGLVDVEAKWELLNHVQRGDLRPMEIGKARSPSQLKTSLDTKDPLVAVVISVAMDMVSGTLT